MLKLDQESIKIAKEELNEDPKQTKSQIDTLRKWIDTVPYLKTPTDDAFLIRFLRNAKFSQLRAQEKLLNFWTVRSVAGEGAPQWFENMDPEDEENAKLFNLGINFPLPGRDDLNRKVIYVNTGGYDTKEISLGQILKLGFMNMDLLLSDELNQIHGFVILLDFSHFTSNHLLNWDRQTISLSSKCWQDVYPTRNKAINYFNTGTIFNTLFEVFQYFMKEKMKQRLHFHKTSQDSLFKQIPRRMLPEELGGLAGTSKKIAADWKTEVIKRREELLNYSKYGVDVTKRPVNTKNESSWTSGVVGSFRKLVVD